jgi:cellulose synthase (UDP-forming)
MNTYAQNEISKIFTKTDTPKILLVINIFLALFYFYILAFWFPQGNKVLYWLLIAGEVFHVFQVVTYIHTIWETKVTFKRDPNFSAPVDVFITVAGEPVDIIRNTVRAAKKMQYPSFQVYILNDGLVANKDNWREVEQMAKEEGVHCITREIPGGAKAGNINNGLKKTSSPYVVIFDADHVPHADFLEKTVGYFTDKKVGFVQTPQFYKNNSENMVTTGAWEQQELFFGPICKGRNRTNSATMCGTNMIISREALVSVGGMQESLTEDFETGMKMHQLGWKSIYVPEILAEGLAPEDFLSYYKQQYRWARGSIDLGLFNNPLFASGLSFGQRIQYLASISFYISGLIVLMNALIPVVFFFTGETPFQISTMTLAAVFLPYIFLTLYILQSSSGFTFTFRSLAFSMGSFSIHIHAFFTALIRKKASFAVTSKTALTGNFIRLAAPHLIYIALAIIGLLVALIRDGLTASVVANVAWAALNVSIFIPFIMAAIGKEVRTYVVKPNLVKPSNRMYAAINK